MENAKFDSVNVLVIEDNELASRVVVHILEKLGVDQVMTADNGANALEILKESNADIDICICDLEMPVMGGYEFIRRVRYGTVPKYKDVPILVLTGADTEKNVKKSRIYRISGFMIKPPTIEDLGQQISQTLGL
ncbi:MAG: response regulator [Rhodospirillales bacterium]|jgi:two-component system chemotaxis response regulator CheY|nr:response regulator [Rhodospirillales bacterium]MDP6884595.1 response regulator [Rhodospirillales bacterium]